MYTTLPVQDIGRRWLEEARTRMHADPASTVVFAHHGSIDHDLVEALVSIADASSRSVDEPLTMRKRLIKVLLEGLENIHHHALALLQDASFTILVRDARGYLFIAGNAVPVATAALLTHRVGILNEMDDADLREHYLKLFSNEARSMNGGAGLGLLTMARKCTRPIVTRSSPLGPFSAFFALELRVEGDDQTGSAAA
jgi:hypothetical protein